MNMAMHEIARFMLCMLPFEKRGMTGLPGHVLSIEGLRITVATVR